MKKLVEYKELEELYEQSEINTYEQEERKRESMKLFNQGLKQREIDLGASLLEYGAYEMATGKLAKGSTDTEIALHASKEPGIEFEACVMYIAKYRKSLIEAKYN